MKKTTKFILLFVFVSIITILGCKKNDKNNDNATPVAPTVTTNSVTAISTASATCGGNITSDGNSDVTARGVCWSTSTSPTIADSKTTNGTGTGTFTSSITGLTANTNYHVRAYATNAIGTSYGNDVSFTTTTQGSSTVTDIDGNVYNTVTIGTQTWMAENLKVTHYRNGDPITNVTVDATWNTLTTEAYCWYNNDYTTYGSVYGALYNWFAVNDSRNICPTGWHVPTDVEWNTLENYLGGASVAGGKLKETGTTHWLTPNQGATNEVGFNALPGGYRYSSAVFGTVASRGLFWTKYQQNIYNAAYVYLMNDFESVVNSSQNLKAGMSLRLVKD